MTSKVFERLVTKFSIKVTDLVKYLEVSKATVYNYRNLGNFCDIPKDKQYKILYLFGKENENELELVLDESDPDVLAGYLSRISSILRQTAKEQKQALSSIEELTMQVAKLKEENEKLARRTAELDKFDGVDEFALAAVLDKVARITSGSSVAEMKEFADYLTIFEVYRGNSKRGG